MHKKARGLEYKLHIYTVDFRTPYVIISLVKKFYVRVKILKKLLTVMCTFLTVFLACPVGVWAAGNGGTGSGVPVWLCIPFAGLLLCVAVMPLVKGEWWESHQPVVVAFWIVLMIIPFAVVYGAGKTAETVLGA